MHLTAIVPVFDGQSVLPECLAAIARSSRRPDEVVVVDDGSSDDSAAIARAHGAELISNTSSARGPAWARNQGAARTAGDILIFIDADVVVHRDALERIEKRFVLQPDLDALFGSYDTSPRVFTTVSRFKNLFHHYVHQHARPDATTFWAGCGAVRRTTFLELEGFDESYRRPSIEDIEFGARLSRAGKHVLLCPEIQCTHLKHWTFSRLVQTDIFSRAVPWTRLVLREGHLPADLNLSWKSRASAVCAWGGLGALMTAHWIGVSGPGAVTLLVGVLCFAATTLLNADLYLFFFQQGGLRFAGATWLLHHVYLLYSSATFAALILALPAERAVARLFRLSGVPTRAREDRPRKP